ncbi:K-homology type RNA binding protein [Cryptosporidium canis]|uniref:K-homology type RNA binding protein n=1 Tax=Cryptosporidium canis TaxID=195482 RepID=A0ABQ8P850_9CRYT|nr:K-homology type RNA binding protein [Cryptosporidium canis]KAJ1614632.1 K-homology type RNA binding protein [Cryptosporidium canis]
MLNILKVGDGQTIAQIESADASFIVGTGGRTRRKLAAVSGTSITIIQDDSKTARVEINGDPVCRERAYLYLKYLIQQKHGPVSIDVNPGSRDDLTIVRVPALCVGYITGKKGQGLRTIEEDSGTLMFFSRPEEECPTDSTPPNHMISIANNHGYSPYILAIFGATRNRRAAELRVMCYIEQKINGHFTKDLRTESYDHIEGLATDIVRIESEDLSYAVGKEGNTRRRLCASSGAIIEYIGNFAFIYGDLNERKRAREYLAWLIAQRTSTVSVDTRAREDVTVVSIPHNVIGYVSGAKGSFLRRVEDETGTFVFVDDNKGDTLERVLIFSKSAFGRQKARDMIERRMYEKMCGYADNKSSQHNRNNISGRNMNTVRKTNDITMDEPHFDRPMKNKLNTASNAFLTQQELSRFEDPDVGLGRRPRNREVMPEHHISDKSGGKPAGLYGGNIIPFTLNSGALF